MPLLEAALAYAARGWRLFPIRPGQKRPATENGLLDATVDRDTIEKWWSSRREFAMRNIGIVTSRASGIWVLDCDVDKETGELGEDTLAALCAVNGALPRCPEQTTPGGGRHYFFAWPDDGADLPRRIRFAAGMDALGSRRDEEGTELAGYLIIAPSERPDGRYQWVVSPDECDPPQAPAWLVAMIREGKRERPADLPRIAPILDGGTTAYGRGSLTKLCAEISMCPPGSQDVTLVSRATRIGSLQAGGNIGYGEAFSAAVDAAMAMRNGDPKNPWTRKVVEKKIARAMAHGAKDPTPPPPSSYARASEGSGGFWQPDAPPHTEIPEGPSMGDGGDRPKPRLIVDNQEKPAEEKKPKNDEEMPPQAKWKNNEWMLNLKWVLNDEGALKSTSLRNLQLYMRHHPALKKLYWYDEFRDEIFVGGPAAKRAVDRRIPASDPRPRRNRTGRMAERELSGTVDICHQRGAA